MGTTEPKLCGAQAGRTPVAVILGAGAGVGQGVARKFAKEGFHVVVVRRGQAGANRMPGAPINGVMDAFVQELQQTGQQATAMFADATSPEEMAELFQKIERDIGDIHFVNCNVGAQIGPRTLEATTYRAFDLALRLGAAAAFACAKEAAKYMVPRGFGTIVYTSATAGMRGASLQLAHSAAMGARRLLSQSVAAELGPM